MGYTHSGCFENGLQHAIAYKEQFGNLFVKENYVCEDGYNLGAWLAIRRSKMRNGLLVESQRIRLEDIGVTADRNEEIWNTKYLDLLAFLKAGGKFKDANKCKSSTGVPLGQWFRREWRKYKKGICLDERVQRLKELHELAFGNTDN